MMATRIKHVPPHKEESEASLIGALIFEPDKTFRIVREYKIEAESFYIPAFKTIFEHIVKRIGNQQPMDMSLLIGDLKASRLLDAVGGIRTLEKCCDGSIQSHSGSYAEEIARCHKARTLIGMCNSTAEKLYEASGHNVEDVLSQAKTELYRLSSSAHAQKAPIETMDTLRATYKKIALARKKGHKIGFGIPSRWESIQEFITGWMPGKMSIIAARPGFGKTTFVLNEAKHKALQMKIPVGVISLEMSVDECIEKMAGDIANVDINKLRRGYLTETEDKRLALAGELIQNSPLIFSPDGSKTIEDIVAIATDMRIEHNVQLIIIDYLQLMKTSSWMHRMSRNLQLQEMSGAIVNLATTTGAHMMVTSQLSRSPITKQGGRGRPTLESLRDSGAIEQDAYYVLFLVPEDVKEKEGVTEIEIAKHRMGPTGTARLVFHKAVQKFAEEGEDIFTDTLEF